ncbi:unnamed protein product [Cuscuta campestris]|uniref:BZIP domain-containing protein n=1 Tax=Cuscuta campestris TaxID=132261 RepID=A0A484M2F1_9ASTE|nr:unnamed protein product [Cuscuta campestris]
MEDAESSLTDSFWNELLKDSHACTHAHTCNPPGPDNSHTHTCYHVHTKIVPPVASGDHDKAAPSGEDTAESVDDRKEGKKRPLGNREAVRKYREKKKARAALLEEEVVRLRALNQQLVKRLQGQAALEAEVARLKCLLVDIRGRIEGVIGCFPYEKQQMRSRRDDVNHCNVQCNGRDSLYCFQPGGGSGGMGSEGTMLNHQGFDNCGFKSLQCLGGANQLISEMKEITNVSGGSEKKSSKRITEQ